MFCDRLYPCPRGSYGEKAEDGDIGVGGVDVMDGPDPDTPSFPVLFFTSSTGPPTKASTDNSSAFVGGTTVSGSFFDTGTLTEVDPDLLGADRFVEAL